MTPGTPSGPGTSQEQGSPFSLRSRMTTNPRPGFPALPDDTIIRIDHITKVFGGKQAIRAVDDVTFTVKKGEIFGLLGPNGAGKSTLIRILTTLLKPTSGTASLGPWEVTRHEEEVRGIIGVCPQNSTLDVELTAYENLEFYGVLVNVREDRLDARIWELLAMAGLTDRAHAHVRTFSGGMKRKLEIVRAFLHHPLILFLDEPTIGLDPESRREVWSQVAMLNQEDTTIILTTHYMDEAEKLCNRIAFINRGKLIALDTIPNLKRSIPAGDIIEVEVDRPDETMLSCIRGLDRVRSVERKGNIFQVSAGNGAAILPHLIGSCEGAGHTITSISIRSPSLEDIFIHLTGVGLGGTGHETPARLGRRGD